MSRAAMATDLKSRVLPRLTTKSTFTSGQKSIRFALAGVVGLSLLSLVGCGSGYSGPKYQDHRILSVDHASGQALSIATSNGWIEAIQSDREDVHIEYHLFGNNEERLINAQVHAKRLDDQTLRIWAQWPNDRRLNGEGVRIRVMIPDANGIEAKSSNGSITVQGFRGHADLESRNGMIKIVDHDGTVRGETFNGKIVAERVSDEIEMYTKNGRVYITDAFGPVRAETSNGHVYISTMHGNLGPVRVRTSNGSVDLDIGVGFEGVLKCDTSHGKINLKDLGDAKLIEASSRHMELQFGDSDEVSAVRTSNGSIRIRQRQ